MVRISHYSILSDPLPDGRYVLMNGISGALDVVSPELGAMLAEALWNERPEEANRAVEYLDEESRRQWLERGHLTELSPEQEREIVAAIASAMHEQLRRLPRFLIVPNLDCNYRCTYCFERPLQRTLHVIGADISYGAGNVVMGLEQVKAVYACIARIQQEAGHPGGGQIILYGGEPLDSAHREVVREIVRQGIARGFYFAAVTNGHHLNEFIELLGRGAIEQVQVSIDGPKHIHDRRRIAIGGGSSFDKVMANIRLVLASTDAEVQIRVHVDPQNIQHFDELLGIFSAEGWLNHPQVVIYTNTVYVKDARGQVCTRMENGDIVRELRRRVASFSNVYTSAPEFHASLAMRPVFEEGERYRLRGTYCAANSGMYVFAPDWHVYACWESIGKACSRLGRYNPDGTLALDEAMVRRWFERSVATVPECQRCAYALVCGGGCAQYAEYNHGSPYHPYCDDFQRIFRSTLAHNVTYFLEHGGARPQQIFSAEPTAEVLTTARRDFS